MLLLQDCLVLSPTQLECPSPTVNYEFVKAAMQAHSRRRRRKRSVQTSTEDFQHLVLKIGFNMDNVESVRDLEKHNKELQSQITYVEDPKFFRFPNEIKLYKGDTLVIEVSTLNK